MAGGDPGSKFFASEQIQSPVPALYPFLLFALINHKRVVHPRVYIGGAFPCLNVSISSSFNFIFSNLQSPLMAGDGGGGGEWRRALEKAVRPRLARTELKL